jgi:hypothetical protein
MTANISKTIKETFEKTKEEGIEEGREKARVEIAIEMLRCGETIAKVAKYSKLSEKDILKLKKKCCNLE